MEDKKKARRREDKKKRLLLLGEQTRLSSNHCVPCTLSSQDTLNACEGCDVYSQLQNIGVQLNNLSNSSFTPPEELTWKTYILLKDKEWSDKSISYHYGISLVSLKEFITNHKNLKKMNGKENEMMKKTSKLTLKDLTPKTYTDLVNAGKKDREIIETYNATYYTLSTWKGKNGLKKEDAKIKSPDKEKPLSRAEEDLQKEIDSMKEKEAELRQTIAELQGQTVNQRKEYLLLEQEKEGFMSKFSALENDMKDVSDKNISLIEELEEARHEILELKSAHPLIQEKDEEDSLFESLLLKRLVSANEQLMKWSERN